MGGNPPTTRITSPEREASLNALRHVVADFSVTMFKTMFLQHAFPGSEHKAEQGNDCYQPNRFLF
jgi:hypothetical protein